MKSVGDAAAQKWTGLQTKIAGDMQSMKSGIAQKKHDWDASRAETMPTALSGKLVSRSTMRSRRSIRRNWLFSMLWPAA